MSKHLKGTRRPCSFTERENWEISRQIKRYSKSSAQTLAKEELSTTFYSIENGSAYKIHPDFGNILREEINNSSITSDVVYYQTNTV